MGGTTVYEIDLWQDHGKQFHVLKEPNNYNYGAVSYASLFLLSTSRYRDRTSDSDAKWEETYTITPVSVELPEQESTGVDIDSSLDFNYTMSILSVILLDANKTVEKFQSDCQFFAQSKPFDDWLTDLAGGYCLLYAFPGYSEVDILIQNIVNQTNCGSVQDGVYPFAYGEWLVDTLSFVKWEDYCHYNFTSIEEFTVYLLNNETDIRCPFEVPTFHSLGSYVTLMADKACALRATWTWTVIKVSSFLVNSVEKTNQEITDLFAGFGGAWAIISLTLSIIFVEVRVFAKWVIGLLYVNI